MELKAKSASLIVKIFAVVFIVVCAVLKWLGIFQSATISEVCIVGGALAAIFGDVSINTAIDKFTKKKEEGEENE